MNVLSKRHIKVRKMRRLSSDSTRTSQAKRMTNVRNGEREFKAISRALNELGYAIYVNGPMG